MHVIQEKWPEILNMVRTEHDLSPIAFTTWLEPLQVYKVEGNTVTIIVPSGTIGVDYINKRYLLPLQVAIVEPEKIIRFLWFSLRIFRMRSRKPSKKKTLPSMKIL